MKALLTVVINIICYSCFAQTERPTFTHTERGMKMVGLQLQLAYVDLFASETALRVDDFSTEAGILISPNVGWFIEKNWLLGGMAHVGVYSNTSDKNSTGGSVRKEKAFDLGITPFTRYYIDLTRRANVKLFLQAGLPVIYSSYKSTYTSSIGSGTIVSRDSNKNVGLYGNWGAGASIHGRFGAIEMNLSSLGLNLGFQKFIARK
jgi:hypothetical protein